MNSLKVILVRHGLSTYNIEGRYQGCSDESFLTVKGLKTAYQTGLALKDYQFDRIYSSPLQRVQQTTREIVKVFSEGYCPDIVLDDRLREINMFTWEGLTYQQVKENFSEAYQCWQQTPHLLAFSQGGSLIFPIPELYRQAELFWQDIFKEHDQKTILIVAHGGTNRALISTALGLSPDKYHSWQQSNCGITYLEFNGRESVTLHRYNSTLHLGEKLPKLKEGNQGLRYIFGNNNYAILDYFKTHQIELINDNNQDSAKYGYGEICQNILTNNEEIKTYLNKYLSIQVNNDNFYIIHSPTKKKRILQSIVDGF